MKTTTPDLDRNIRTAYRPDGTVKGWLVRFTADDGTPFKRYFSASDSSLQAARAWRDDNQRVSAAAPGTFKTDVQEYLRLAPITKATRVKRAQQLAFLGAQTIAFGSPVQTVDDWCAEKAAIEAGCPPPSHGRTIDEEPRSAVPLKRWREILAVAFAPSDPDSDPEEGASTSNHYRTALMHLYGVLAGDEDSGVNPISRIGKRTTRGAEAKGLDMRVVAEVLKHVATKYSREARVSELRLAVLAWVNIEPKQLQAVNPTYDFHDLPHATREEMIDGAITLTCDARRKGETKVVKPALLKFLTPYGVEAMRAFAAEPKAWGRFSTSSLRKSLKVACRKAQVALAKQGIQIDLSQMTVKHLKHSLLSAMQLATQNRVSSTGALRIDPGVSGAGGHDATMTRIYIQRIEQEAFRLVSRDTALFLDRLLAQPLVPSPSTRTLRVVGGQKAGSN